MASHWLTPAETVDPDWFRPLERFAATAAALHLPVVNPDHFLYSARIIRDRHPVLHAYRHIATKKYLNIDEEGTAWRYTGSDRAGVDRYSPFGRIDLALASVDIGRGNQLCAHLRQEAIAIRAAEAERAAASATTDGDTRSGVYDGSPGEGECPVEQESPVDRESPVDGIDAGPAAEAEPDDVVAGEPVGVG